MNNQKNMIGGKPPKVIEPFDNVIRHFLEGKFPNGYVQCELRMEIKKDRLIIQILSFDDGSVLKEFDKKYNIGDMINYPGLKVAYAINFYQK